MRQLLSAKIGRRWGNAIRAYDIDATSIETARKNAVEALMEKGCPASQAQGPEPAALLVVLFGNQCSLSFQGFLSCGSPRRCRRGGTWGTRVPPVRRGAGPSGCSTRAPITCDIGRVRCTHTMEPPSGGRRFGHPPGVGRAPRRMPRGPERGEGMGGNQPMGQKPPEAHDSFVVTRSSQS